MVVNNSLILSNESIDTELKDAIIEIFNRNGQKVFTTKTSFESGKYQLSTDAANIQNTGIYFLRITSKEGSRILKFTKVHKYNISINTKPNQIII